MSTPVSGARSRILRNSFWFGLESVIELVVFLSSSVAVARYLGPAKLGYYSYINFFVSVVTRTGGSGISGATRKYMAEFLGLDQLENAKAVYHLAYKYQFFAALGLTSLGLGAVFLLGDPAYHLVSVILVLSIVPGLMSWVPAQANNAFEDARKNTTSAFGYLVAYAVLITLTLIFKWNLVGVALATLVGRTVEVLLRTRPLHARLRPIPIVALDSTTTGRIRRFCLEAMGTQILMTVVWDRSEMLFLKAYSGLDQISYYSISFSLAGNLLVIPRILTGATGMTLMVEASRDVKRIQPIVRNACRFLLLFVFPIYLGAAAIAGPAIRATFGPRYAAAVPVLIIAAVLSIPRAFQEIPEVLIRAADKQKRLFMVIAAVGILNLGLDWALIPKFAAVGAAWGNGISQALGIVAFWYQARRSFAFTFPVAAALRLGASGTVMALLSFWVAHRVPGVAGLIMAILIAVPVYVGLVRIFGGLQSDDRERMAQVAKRLPMATQRLFQSLIDWTVPGA